MGSEYYAYFDVESDRVASRELDELAEDAGAGDIPHAGSRTQIVARLDAASKVKQGEPGELWFDSRRLQLFDPESGRSLVPAGNGN